MGFVTCEFSLLCVHKAFQHLLFKYLSYPLPVVFVTSLLCTLNVFFQFCLVLFNISIPSFIFFFGVEMEKNLFSTSFSTTNPTLSIFLSFFLFSLNFSLFFSFFFFFQCVCCAIVFLHVWEKEKKPISSFLL